MEFVSSQFNLGQPLLPNLTATIFTNGPAFQDYIQQRESALSTSRVLLPSIPKTQNGSELRASPITLRRSAPSTTTFDGSSLLITPGTKVRLVLSKIKLRQILSIAWTKPGTDHYSSDPPGNAAADCPATRGSTGSTSTAVLGQVPPSRNRASRSAPRTRYVPRHGPCRQLNCSGRNPRRCVLVVYEHQTCAKPMVLYRIAGYYRARSVMLPPPSPPPILGPVA